MSEQSKPGPAPRVTDREILTILRETDDPVLSTAEVADKLPIKRRATLTRLQRLAESGALARKQAGGRNTVWWLTDESALATDERDPEAILDDLDTFLDERDGPDTPMPSIDDVRDGPDTPMPSIDDVRDDYHARRHRENLERLALDE